MQDLTSAFADGTLFIDGSWGPASTGRTFEVTDPATGEVLAKCDDADVSDTQRALDAAERAQVGWARTTAYERAELLERAERLMRERADDLATLMVREQGKPLRAARNEVQYGADFLSWFAGEARRIYGSTIPSSRPDQRFLVLRQPVGVVAAVTPWNYPISMITRKVGPALAAGCTVVLKPAKQTPLCAAAIVDILREAGLPDGVVNMVTTNNSSIVVDAMLESSIVRKLTFTGSTEIGKILGRKAADGVKRVSLELGGHAPFIVFGDADASYAAKGAAALKFLNAGQACICPNRIYVQRELVDEFLDTMVKRVGAMRTGNGLEDGVAVGPLIDAPSLAKMERQVADATAKGATVLVGGERLTGEEYDRGQFFAPTVLTGVTPEMEIYTEETFGPIAPVIPFDDEDEVVRLANDTTYGLASYLYTRDLSRALRVSEQLQFGIVGINDVNPTSAAAPFGGIKESGLGREGGATGIDEYLDVKLIGISLTADPAVVEEDHQPTDRVPSPPADLPPGMTVTGTLQRQAWADRVLPPVETVRPGLWSVPVPLPESPLRYVSMYVLELANGVAVVDTGWPVEVAWDALTSGLAETGHALTDVRAILITHAHSDHHGLAGRLREASGAWVGMHPLEAEHVTRVLPAAGGRMRLWLDRCGVPADEAEAIESQMSRVGRVVRHLAAPDVLVEDGSRPLGRDVPLRAVWTPGHTPGHLCFYDERHDLLLSGDHVLPRISPNIALNSIAAGNPLRDFLASLRAVAALDPVEVLPAHEYRFAGLAARVDALVAHHDARMAEIEDVLRAQPGATTWAVAERLTWSRPWAENSGSIRQSAVAETLAHLAHLVELRRVESRGGAVDAWFLTR